MVATKTKSFTPWPHKLLQNLQETPSRVLLSCWRLHLSQHSSHAAQPLPCRNYDTPHQLDISRLSPQSLQRKTFHTLLVLLVIQTMGRELVLHINVTATQINTLAWLMNCWRHLWNYERIEPWGMAWHCQRMFTLHEINLQYMAANKQASKQASIHMHIRAQCSHATVGLA